MNIASYYASIGFKVDNRDIQKVDRAISTVEKKLKDFSKRLSASYTINLVNFNVNERNLQRALGNALDIASTRTAFEVSRFVVDQSALNRNLTTALRTASTVASNSVQIRPNINRNTTIPTTHSGVPHSELNRRTRTYAGMGGIGLGLMGPLGYGALALAGGGYGLGALNRRNQEVVSAQLQAQAVVQQAGGTVEQGQQSFQWLRQQGERIGFNYLDASPDYNKLLSGLTGAGMSIQQGQNVYKGFAELSRVNKLDRVQQQRVFRALSQIAGKNKLQSEELSGQLAESLPGAVSLFARAYQQQIGGNKTGQEAITQLLDAMKKGQVKGDILTYAGTLASQQAAPSLEAAGRASQAEQARYQNRVNDLAVLASNAGVEEGFARIFRTLNAGLGESNGLVQSLAEGFNEVTKWADDLLLFPQSFIRMLEGKDSLVADWLGYDTSRQLVEDWKQIKELWSQISSIKAEDIFGDFLPSLESTSRELAAILNTIKGIKDLKDGNLPTQKVEVEDIPKIDPFGTGGYTSPVGILKAGYNNFLVNLNERQQRNEAIFNPDSIYYNDPAGYDQMQMDRKQFSEDSQRLDLSRYNPQSKAEIDDFNNQQRLAAMDDANIVRQSTTNNEITIQLNIDPITLAQMDIQAQAQELTQAFATNLEQVLVQFPNKE